MRSLLYAPKISTFEDLHDQVVRVAWYLDHLEDCSFSIDTDLSLDAVQPADYIDTTVGMKIASLRAAGRLVIASEPQESTWDGVIAWSGVAAARQSLSGSLEEQDRAGELEIYNVDRNHRMESSLYIDVANRLSPNELNIAEFHDRFRNLTAKLECENAYLFCTGPSVEEYAHYDFRSGVSIICNSVIFDEELLNEVDPKILVFADPIFHFGCSTYAEQFRKKLADVADRFDLTLIVPVKYVNVFLANSPQLESRLIAVPYDKNVEITLDLRKSFKAYTTDNILTFLMMPVAGSIANKIYLLGCDGRKIEDDSYFWSHNAKTQISSEMENIQQAHPSFFKLDYNEYYLRHCETLERYAEVARRSEQDVIGLTFSHIEALRGRPYDYEDLSKAERVFVSINPDLLDEFGHFHHYDLRVKDAIPENSELIVWANQSARGLTSDMRVEPVFRKNTYHMRSEFGERMVLGFKRTLHAQLESLSLLGSKKTIYMYTGDVLHARAIVELAEAHPALFHNTDMHINLFYAHFDLDVETNSLGRLFAYQNVLLDVQELPNSPIKLYVDSVRAKNMIDSIAGPGLNEWPMIQVSSMDSQNAANGESAIVNSEVVTVFCPATGQKSKGYDIAIKAIKHLIDSGYGERYVFRLRDMLRDSQVNNVELEELQNSLKPYSCVEFLVGVVSDSDYLAEYESADIILLPYSRNHFYSRTSGAIIDALYFAKPVVCVSDTWLEEQAAKFDLAFDYTESDIEGCASKILEAASKISTCDMNQVRARWVQEYRPSRLLDTFSLVQKQFTFSELHTASQLLEN